MPKEGPVKKKAKTNSLGFLPKPQDPCAMEGKEITLLGEMWGESCAAGDRSKRYRCVINKFDGLRPANTWEDNIPSAGFELVEMGEDGHSGNSESFWVKYPEPFMKYWQASKDVEDADKLADVSDGEDMDDDWEVDEDGETGQKDPPRVMKYFSRPLETIECAEQEYGKSKRKRRCTIIDEATGKQCTSTVNFVDKDTGAGIKHIRNKAKRCKNHREAINDIDKVNPRRTLDSWKNSAPEAEERCCHTEL